MIGAQSFLNPKPQPDASHVLNGQKRHLMNMKKLSGAALGAALIFALSTSLPRAQDVTSTNQTNAMGMTAETNTSNTTSLAKVEQNKSPNDGAVRIDSTGVHVGAGNGSPPVDIGWGNPNAGGKTLSHCARLPLHFFCLLVCRCSLSPLYFTPNIAGTK